MPSSRESQDQEAAAAAYNSLLRRRRICSTYKEKWEQFFLDSVWNLVFCICSLFYLTSLFYQPCRREMTLWSFVTVLSISFLAAILMHLRQAWKTHQDFIAQAQEKVMLQPAARTSMEPDVPDAQVPTDLDEETPDHPHEHDEDGGDTERTGVMFPTDVLLDDDDDLHAGSDRKAQ